MAQGVDEGGFPAIVERERDLGVAAAGEDLEGEAGEGVDIGGGGVAAEELFGGHVLYGAGGAGVLGEGRLHVQSGGAEVDDDGLAGGVEHDVFGFEVRVDDAVGVSGGEDVGEAGEEL